MSANQEVSAALAKVDLFAGLSGTAAEQIASIARVANYSEGDVIYRPGDTADDVYVLLDGRVNFRMQPDNYDEIPATIMSGKKTFGWAALVPDHPNRVAIASCLDPSRVIALNGDQVSEILQRHPEDGFQVMKRLTSIVASSFMPN